MPENLLTISGKRKLEKEYDHLIKVERPKNIQAIEEARAHGDLKENAEYHAAKERQSFIQTRIEEISTKLASCEVIDPLKIKSDKVVFGATVKLLNNDTNEEYTYQIVREDEANVKNGTISYKSPISRAMIGKYIDDEFIVKTPKGKVEYTILGIEYK